jgi:hypothetical protein
VGLVDDEVSGVPKIDEASNFEASKMQKIK